MMLLLLLFRPRIWWAILHDLYSNIAAPKVGPQCRVTRQPVFPRDRVLHERDVHPADGPCVLL